MATTIWAQANPTGVSGYSTTTETNATYGLAFTVAQSGTAQAVWFYSPAGSTTLPAEVGVYLNTFISATTGNSTGTLLSSNTSPSWSGAAGSGWVRATIPAASLSSGNTYVAYYYTGSGTLTSQAFIFTGSLGSTGTPVAWFPSTSGDGNINAPALLGGVSGCSNGPFTNGADAYPSTYNGNSLNWVLDVEVSFSSAAPSLPQGWQQPWQPALAGKFGPNRPFIQPPIVKTSSGMTLNLPVAQENVNALTPAEQLSLALNVAQVNINALAPSARVQLALTVAQVNINALAPVTKAQLSLPVAQVNINALAPTLRTQTALSVAQVNINAPAPTIKEQTGLSVAQVNINALPLTIGAGQTVSLTTAQVNIAALAPSIKEQLGLSVAQETVAALSPSIKLSEGLAVAQETVAALVPSVRVTGALSAAGETSSALSPSMALRLALAPAQVTVAALPVTAASGSFKPLEEYTGGSVSWASAGGTASWATGAGSVSWSSAGGTASCPVTGGSVKEASTGGTVT